MESGVHVRLSAKAFQNCYKYIWQKLSWPERKTKCTKERSKEPDQTYNRVFEVADLERFIWSLGCVSVSLQEFTSSCFHLIIFVLSLKVFACGIFTTSILKFHEFVFLFSERFAQHSLNYLTPADTDLPPTTVVCIVPVAFRTELWWAPWTYRRCPSSLKKVWCAEVSNGDYKTSTVAFDHVCSRSACRSQSGEKLT